MMDAAQSNHLTGVYADPDAFVQAIGEHLAFAPTPEDLAEQVRDTLRAVMENTQLLGAGASQHLLDRAISRLAQAVEPLQHHLVNEPTEVAVDVGLRSAAAVIRSYGAHSEAADAPSAHDLEMWLDNTADFANAMINAFLLQRMEARMRAHGQRGSLERLGPAITPSTMH